MSLIHWSFRYVCNNICFEKLAFSDIFLKNINVVDSIDAPAIVFHVAQ